jgi:hypothetical protein
MGDLMRWRCVGCGTFLLGRAIDNPLMLKHHRPVRPGGVPTLCREDGVMQLVEHEAETHSHPKVSADFPSSHGMTGDSVIVADTSAWQSHAWIARQLELEPGAPVVQHTCANCGRNFVEEIRTSGLYAVHVAVLRFDRLSA